ncbi:hypothetical protein LSAT2_006494, partial [Lamellibrachia satsuma]
PLPPGGTRWQRKTLLNSVSQLRVAAVVITSARRRYNVGPPSSRRESIQSAAMNAFSQRAAGVSRLVPLSRGQTVHRPTVENRQ